MDNEKVWQQYLSIDERKCSTLLICLIVSLLFAGICYLKFGDITANLASIITALIYAIAGVNATNMIGSYMNRNVGFQSQNQIMPNAINQNPIKKGGRVDV